MKYILLLFTVFFISFEVQAQSTVAANLTVGRAQASCGFTRTSTLEFGSLYRPLTQTTNATLEADNDTATLDYAPGAAGPPSFGAGTLTGANVENVTIEVSFPDNLSDGESSPTTVTFTENWASSTAASGASWTDHGTSTTQTYTSDSSSKTLTRFIHFGGSVPIEVSQNEDTYTGTISITVTCAQAT